MTRGPLETALASRDCEGVRRAIADGEAVNVPFADGLTALYEEMMGRVEDPELAEALLAQLEGKTRDEQWTLLLEARAYLQEIEEDE